MQAYMPAVQQSTPAETTASVNIANKIASPLALDEENDGLFVTAALPEIQHSMVQGEKEKQTTRLFHRLSVTHVLIIVVLLYGWLLVRHLGSSQSAVPHPPGTMLPEQQEAISNALAHLNSSDIKTAAGTFSLPSATLQHFPQAGRCTTKWMQQYARMQADIQHGKLPARYLVSVAVEAGLADRLAGLLTHLWHAVLTRRALTSIAYGSVPSFDAVCDAPFIRWTQPPAQLPAEAVEPLKFTFLGERGYPGHKRFLPDSLDPKTYQMLYLINGPIQNLTVYEDGNISAIHDPDPAYLMAASNRGRSFALANNPHHQQQFWEYGVVPQDAFMCGFFFLCSPVAAIQQYYQQYWDALQAPDVLKIGIQIRLGDHVFKGAEAEQTALQTLEAGKDWFECAQLVEDQYAVQGQKIIWYLNSDSLELRKAAKAVYGDKLLTDVALRMTHPDCHHKPKGVDGTGDTDCKQTAMEEALQHSLGAMLTFSMTNYHIIARDSGFGRLGAWLSGRWRNIYQIAPGQGSAQCKPGSPVLIEQSAFDYQGV